MLINLWLEKLKFVYGKYIHSKIEIYLEYAMQKIMNINCLFNTDNCCLESVVFNKFSWRSALLIKKGLLFYIFINRKQYTVKKYT